MDKQLSTHARRRLIRVTQTVFAAAAIFAVVALCTGARSADIAPLASPAPLAAPNVAGHGGLGTDTFGDPGINDNGQTSGDIFTQNAQDQSTADGAGNN